MLQKTYSLKEVMQMTPLQMALCSPHVQMAKQYLVQQIDKVKNERTKKQLAEMFNQTKPSFLQMYKTDSQKKELYEELIEQNYLYDGIDFKQFLPSEKLMTVDVGASSGSNYNGHHAYPGGLVVHVEENLRLSLYLRKMHKKMFGIDVDRDTIIFAQVAHDLAKVWILPWLDDDSCFAQYGMADTGAHHIFSLAESIYRKVAPQAVFAQASTHVIPSKRQNYQTIAGFIRSACVIAKVDPVEYGFFDRQGNLCFNYKKMQNWFCYMGDHMVVFTVPSLKIVVKELAKIAIECYDFSEQDLLAAKFNKLRNFVLSQMSVAFAYQLLDSGGKNALREQVVKLIK